MMVSPTATSPAPYVAVHLQPDAIDRYRGLTRREVLEHVICAEASQRSTVRTEQVSAPNLRSQMTSNLLPTPQP